jgi:hypothetical protein
MNGSFKNKNIDERYGFFSHHFGGWRKKILAVKKKRKEKHYLSLPPKKLASG